MWRQEIRATRQNWQLHLLLLNMQQRQLAMRRLSLLHPLHCRERLPLTTHCRSQERRLLLQISQHELLPFPRLA